MQKADPKCLALIELFNQTFQESHQTQLICCEAEPVYQPADQQHPYHRIIFAHGFFASALHEIAHWTIAGASRRMLEDYGYWYQPDGRTEAQQAQFEEVEIKPQALEWIYSVASGHPFEFSADNLENSLPISDSFKHKVFEQVETYLDIGLPKDGKTWLEALLNKYRPNQPLQKTEFSAPRA